MNAMLPWYSLDLTSVATSKIEHDASCQSLQGQAKIPRIKQDVDIM